VCARSETIINGLSIPSLTRPSVIRRDNSQVNQVGLVIFFKEMIDVTQKSCPRRMSM